tara:strand:- start:207 stop:494 length:288 start_codon:yes stop_codon:yes gene_type:complete
MELDNIHIVLIEHLYNYEVNTSDSELSYWNIKNVIFQKCLLNEKQLEKNELELIENNIYQHYKYYKLFNFANVFDSKNPITYITYLSHMKKKIID